MMDRTKMRPAPPAERANVINAVQLGLGTMQDGWTTLEKPGTLGAWYEYAGKEYLLVRSGDLIVGVYEAPPPDPHAHKLKTPNAGSW